ncbi:MAG: TonB-dependent receptor [Bacteroidota bacterium]
MTRLFFISLFLCLSTMADLAGQDSDLQISGDFIDVPFLEFVEKVEEQTGVSFYFLKKWIKGIRVTAPGEEISLRRTLDRTLLPAGLNYVIANGNQVYLTDQAPFVASLPDYSEPAKEDPLSSDPDELAGLTSTERKYIDGRKAGSLETITLGTAGKGEGLTSVVIHGKMTDVESDEPLIGATIYFEELRMGAATDMDGRFSIVVPPGKYTTEFKCMGMEEKTCYMDVLSGANLSMGLERSVISLTEVVVHANRYHNVRGTQMGFDRLNYKVLKEVPVLMGEKDVLKVVQMLPGVQSVGEGAAGFNVRGSGADQNMIYINKVPVYNSSHLFGFFTSFSPDIVKDFTLYKSNLPASYGGRLASFFDISTRQGNMNKYTARGGISPVTGHLSLEGPIVKDKAAIILSGRSTYSDWMLKQLEDPTLRDSQAKFNDLAGAITWETGEKTLIKAFGYLSKDQFSLGTTNDYAYSNAGASLNIRRRFGSRMNGELGLVFGEYQFSTTDQQVASEAYTQDYRISHYELKADLSWLSLGKHKITYGANGIFYDLDRGTIKPYGDLSLRAPLELGIEYGAEGAVYIADEISLFPWLTLYGGLRFAGYKSLGPDEVMIYGDNQALIPGNVVDTLSFEKFEVSSTYTSLEPRAALNLMMGPNNSLKFSYNRVRQFMFMMSNTIAISPTDQWKLCDYHMKPPFVDQYSMGYYLDIPKGSVSTSLELYYKTISDVIDYKDGANFISTPHIETLTLRGNQEAYGVEAMIRKNAGKVSGWMAYSYSRSFMHVVSPFPGESINEGNRYPSNYDRPHSLNVVSSFKLNRRLSLSSNVVYMTGRPVTYPISIYYVEGMQYIDYSDRNSYRIPDYFRLDISINLEGNLKKRKLFHSFWMLNFYNVTGRQNAYSVYFQNEEGIVKGYKLSIFGQTIITLSWNFKLGNYASE